MFEVWFDYYPFFAIFHSKVRGSGFSFLGGLNSSRCGFKESRIGIFRFDLTLLTPREYGLSLTSDNH